MHATKKTGTHRQDALAEHDNVHVQRLEIGGAVRILIEAPKTNEVVTPEEFNLLASFLHLDVFCGQGVDGEHLEEAA